MANRKRKQKIPGPFLALPWIVINSPAYMSLSFSAKALLIDVAMQYQGGNNGDLAVTWKLMRRRGWSSETTMHKAKAELLEKGLLFETRKGRRPAMSQNLLNW